MKTTVIISLAVLALAACETPNGAGTGSGNVRGTQKPVAFTWQSDDSNSGDITASSNGSYSYSSGIYAHSDQGSVAVDNSGSLSASDNTGFGAAWGVYAYAYGDATVGNSGNVYASGGSATATSSATISSRSSAPAAVSRRAWR